MTDDQIEAALQRFRVPDPRPVLRERAIEAARRHLAPRDHLASWSIAAAALLMLTLALQSASVRMIARYAPTDSDVTERTAQDLAAILGGGPSARYVADRIMAEHEERAASTAETAGISPGGRP
jgi:hypothetical protein